MDMGKGSQPDISGNQPSRWTRKQLLIITFVFLIATNITTLIFFILCRTSKSIENFKNPYPLIDPARSVIDQKNFIINIQYLRDYLKTLAEESKPNVVGIYFEILNTGANISINQDTRFWPASLGKIPVAFAVMKKIENGDWQLENELVLFEEDRDDRFGDLYKKPTGERFTIEELLKIMLIHSDNTAQNILIRNTETESFEDLLNGLGLAELFDKNYDITAKEYSRLFRALFTSSYLKRENSEKILRWLAQTPFNEFLGQAIPNDVIFSHKTGEQDEQNVYLDSGIIYIPDRPFLITVMIKISEPGAGKEKAGQIMKTISEKAYEYVKNY